MTNYLENKIRGFEPKRGKAEMFAEKEIKQDIILLIFFCVLKDFFSPRKLQFYDPKAINCKSKGFETEII